MASSIKNEPLIKKLDQARSPIRRTKVKQSDDEEVEYLAYDSWHNQQRGEEYRYGQRRPYGNAKRAYQAAAALAEQQVTHQAFYMEDLGKEQEVHAQSLPLNDTPTVPRRYMLPTRFYPDGGQNDSISKIQGIGRVQMQRIYPNYELSTSETRESGLGPQIEVVERHVPKKK